MRKTLQCCTFGGCCAVNHTPSFAHFNVAPRLVCTGYVGVCRHDAIVVTLSSSLLSCGCVFAAALTAVPSMADVRLLQLQGYYDADGNPRNGSAVSNGTSGGGGSAYDPYASCNVASTVGASTGSACVKLVVDLLGTCPSLSCLTESILYRLWEGIGRALFSAFSCVLLFEVSFLQ